MLEDLRLVRKNEAPKYARRVVDLESLAKIEETGKTVDLTPSPAPAPAESFAPVPMVLLYWIAGVSLFANIILVVLLILLHK
jgi:hypothetical protein